MTSLLVVLLTTLGMTLLPQKAWADDDDTSPTLTSVISGLTTSDGVYDLSFSEGPEWEVVSVSDGATLTALPDDKGVLLSKAESEETPLSITLRTKSKMSAYYYYNASTFSNTVRILSPQMMNNSTLCNVAVVLTGGNTTIIDQQAKGAMYPIGYNDITSYTQYSDGNGSSQGPVLIDDEYLTMTLTATGESVNATSFSFKQIDLYNAYLGSNAYSHFTASDTSTNTCLSSTGNHWISSVPMDLITTSSDYPGVGFFHEDATTYNKTYHTGSVTITSDFVCDGQLSGIRVYGSLVYDNATVELTKVEVESSEGTYTDIPFTGYKMESSYYPIIGAHFDEAVTVNGRLRLTFNVANSNHVDYLTLRDIVLFGVTATAASTAESYGFSIGETEVTSENIQHFKGISFSEGILTLENAYYDDVLQTSLAELTIKVIGSNNHFGGIRYSGQYETSTLTFIKDEQSEEDVCSLALEGTEYAAISGFTSVNYGEGMSLAAAYGTEYSERGYLYNSTISSYVEYVYDATITSADVYQLWYKSEQVTSENAATLEKSYDDNSVTASFDGKTSTLTFNNLGGGYGGHAVISNMENLNVYLVGENSMSGESQSFFYTPSQSAKINFQTSDDAPGSLTMYSMGVPFEGFVEANIIYENDLKYTLTPQYSADDPSVVENYTATIQVPPYGLIVYTEGEPNGVQVTKENRTNVLGEDQPTVQFDGRSRLVLNGATLQKIETGLDEGAELELYLEGSNTISGSSNAIIDTNQRMPKLVIDTDGNNPGSLTLGGTSGVIQGFQSAEIKQPLAILSSTPENATSLIGTTAAITSAHVGAPLGLIVDGVSSTPQTTETAINYSDISGANEPVAASALTNLVINNVLYTLNDDGTVGSPDGYDGSRGQIVLNSTMTDDDVTALNRRVENESLVPGSNKYAKAFNGLTFMVPAGTGTITLNTKTDLAHEFHLKVGGQDPITVINYTDNNDVDFAVDYAVSKSTYVYLYLVKKSSATAPGYDGHRAGPKATISGGIGGMKVESSSIAVVPEPSTPYYQMTASDYSKAADGSKHGIKVTNTAVTDLPDNAFATASPAPAYSGNRAPAGDISYIDLSETQITGKVYNRSTGAFAGVPENTVIYLPAGNMAVGPNFVIGGICDDMQLDADTEEAFELSKDFTAAKASFDRSFAAGKDAHDNYKCYTVYLPYAVNIAKTGGDFFTCGEYNAATGTINMTQVTAASLEANTAYIYKPAADGQMSPMMNVEVKKPTTASDPTSTSEATGLHGVYEYHQWTSEPGNVYCFAAGDATAENGKPIKAGQFVKVGSGTHIKPFRAYLRINVPAGGSAPEYVAVDWGNGTTSIVPLDKTQVSQDADGWYTITGFRLPAKPTEKGIYIHNNKKTIVK